MLEEKEQRHVPLLRFVVLRHEGVGATHFDLMFETRPGSVLASWRAETWPLASGDVLTRGPDHGPHWLTHQGAVSGGRGMAWRVAEGACREATLGDGRMEVTFADGTSLTLVRDASAQWVCGLTAPA